MILIKIQFESRLHYTFLFYQFIIFFLPTTIVCVVVEGGVGCCVETAGDCVET